LELPLDSGTYRLKVITDVTSILEQMRLESQRGLWPRVRVGGRKINRAFLKEKENTDLKLRYYELMIQLALHEDAYLDACKAYQEVWDTEEVKKDEAKSQEVGANRLVHCRVSTNP
jgi:26S proteasome regulatory subunit N5